MERHALGDPEFWRQIAALSPKLQAQFWLRAPENESGRDFGANPKLVKSLREAAKGGEVTRAALEWCLQSTALLRDDNYKPDGAAFLGFAKALKDERVSTASIAVFLCRSYSMLPRMENPGVFMAETPALLEGLKTFPNEQVVLIFQSIENLWQLAQRDRRKVGEAYSKTALPAPVYPVETAALVKFILTRNFDPSRSKKYRSGMTPIILATGDADLLGFWIKFSGKSLVGDCALIVLLLEKDRVAEAVVLAPAANRIPDYSRQFNSHLESLVAKLRTVPTPKSFGLMVWLSQLPDAYGAEAPVEKSAARIARLTNDFERVRGGMPISDRADLCLALNLTGTMVQTHVPALDDFASEAAAMEFQKLLLAGESSSTVAKLFVPAVCSRVYTDDLSGITLLSAAIAAAPPGQRSENLILEYIHRPVQTCLAAYANRLDAKLPEASVEVILTYAKALADRKQQEYLGIASQLVYLAATDAASLEGGLKLCGLEGVKPTAAYNPNGGGGTLPETLLPMMRVALLHPATSEALLESFGTPQINDSMPYVILPLLQAPQLRARISPALFLKWNRDLRVVAPKDLEAMELYATERRGDFDEAQRVQLDGLLQRLQDSAKPIDPARVEEMRRRQLEENKLRRD